MLNNRTIYFKRSAIHNLIVTRSINHSNGKIKEGVVIPENLLKLADIQSFEQIIVTKITGDNWRNRVYSFAIPGKSNEVEVRGSLSYFLNEGDLVCIITRSLIDSKDLKLYINNELPSIDIGFNPLENHGNDICNAKIYLEYFKGKQEVKSIAKDILLLREKLRKINLSSLITGLKITETSLDCLQGSAEFPEFIMKEAGLVKYQAIFVYNLTRGGIPVETYCIPTPFGVVRSTGAMAEFARKGEEVAISSYEITTEIKEPTIILVKNNVIDYKIKPK